jgi:tetratricopeptide (TPR) repeat protein
MITGDLHFMKRSILPAAFSLAALLSSGAAFAQAPAAAPPVKIDKKGPGPKSQAEVQAVTALFQSQAQAADDEIAAAEALLTKFADSDYKAIALEIEAEAYQRKNDNAKAITYGEQALQADPKNFDADNLLANVIAATTRDTDLDKDEKLAKAEKYAHDAMDALQAGKPPLFAKASDAAWAKTVAGAQSLSWQALGNVALVRKKTDEAIADFEKGIEANPDPILMVRTGRALLAAKKPDEAIMWFQKVIDSPDAPAQIKTIAQSDKARAEKSKPTASK